MERIDHIAITVADIKEAVKWYNNKFSCEITYEDKSWAMLKFENINLALVLERQHPPHIAFEQKKSDPLHPLTIHRDGTQSRYIEDPWGNKVELMKTK